MSLVFGSQDIVQVEEDAWRHFGCEPVPHGRHGGNRRDRNAAKRQKVSRYLQEFVDVMSGPNPPKSEDEAVRMIVPAMSLLFSWLFEQLAIMVVKWLWARASR